MVDMRAELQGCPLWILTGDGFQQAIWAKGYTELLDLMEKDSASREMHTHVDCYGYGDDLEEVRTSLTAIVSKVSDLICHCSGFRLPGTHLASFSSRALT